MSASGRLENRVIVALCVVAFGSLLFSACGEDGESPLCPDVARYDISKAGERNSPEVEEDRAAAVDAGCMTRLYHDAGTD